MSHRYLLALARLALFSLLASGTVNASVYNICNKGKIEVRYATAVRQGGFLSGYSWDVDGWYPIGPGKCDDAYHHSNHATDPPIYVAVAFTDSTGVWGAATFQGEDVDTKLCLNNDTVGYHLNGDVDQPCKSGFSKFPAALYLEPRDRGCADNIGLVCFGYTYDFAFALDANSRAIAVNKGSGGAPASSDSATASSGPSMGTTLAVLGALVVGAAILAEHGQTTGPPETTVGGLTGVYSGRVHNTTVQLWAPFEITIREQQGHILSGCMAVHRPLHGSGRLSGDSRNSRVTFEVPSSIGVIRFTGSREGDSIKGTYVVQQTGSAQFGEFELHRQGELATDFNDHNCPDDSVVH
jgi:hypothetical protein